MAPESQQRLALAKERIELALLVEVRHKVKRLRGLLCRLMLLPVFQIDLLLVILRTDRPPRLPFLLAA
jgi:hypothetical protein